MLRTMIPFLAAVLIGAVSHAAPTTSASTRQTPSPSIIVLRERLVASLIPADPAQRKSIQALAKRTAEALREDGTWPDINYTDQARTRWLAADHLQRVLLMAKSQAIHPDSALRTRMNLAIKHWLERDYQNPNWWWNQ